MCTIDYTYIIFERITNRTHGPSELHVYAKKDKKYKRGEKMSIFVRKYKIMVKYLAFIYSIHM